MAMDVTRWNFHRLYVEVIQDRTTCLNWCMVNGLLPIMKVCPEGHIMNLNLFKNDSNKRGPGRFKCAKNHVTNKHGIVFSMLTNTFFQRTKLRLEKLMILIYCFTCHDLNHADCIHETSIFNETTSPETIADLNCHCRELITDYFLKFREYSGKLGGEGVVVEVQEWKFRKRRFVGNFVDEMRAVGIVETTSHRFYVIQCPSNEQDPQALFQTIEEHVNYGTTIVIKDPEIYQDMSRDYDFICETSKSSWSENSTMSSQPQTTIPNSSSMKLISSFNCETSYGDYMVEYLWRRELKMTDTDAFDYFLGIIRCQYPM